MPSGAAVLKGLGYSGLAAGPSPVNGAKRQYNTSAEQDCDNLPTETGCTPPRRNPARFARLAREADLLQNLNANGRNTL